MKSKSGILLEELTLERVARGGDMADFSISAETLLRQAEVAASNGRRQLAENLMRAAELVAVPDEKILEIYSALRPDRATWHQLQALATELRDRFQAPACARWVEEAAAACRRFGLLRPEA